MGMLFHVLIVQDVYDIYGYIDINTCAGVYKFKLIYFSVQIRMHLNT